MEGPPALWKDHHLRTVEAKISEALSQKILGEEDSQPWICHVEKHPSDMSSWQKP